MANEFLTDKEHCQCVLNWLLGLAYVDGTFSSEEQQLVKGFAATLNIEYAEKKNCKEELSRAEIVFTLREMYRLALSDGEFSDCEQDVLNEFISKYEVPAEVVSATKNWLDSLFEIEKKYKSVVTNYIGE